MGSIPKAGERMEKMVKLKEIRYKRSTNRDGSIFSESLEISVDATDNDNFLDGAQVLQLSDVANQVRNINVDIMNTWSKEAPSTAIVPTPGVNVKEAAPIPQQPDLKPGYNPDRKRWGSCTCGNDKINHKSKTSGMFYQACFNCHKLLGKDGNTKPMDR